MDCRRCVFLLGGKDLEMSYVESMLKLHEVKYFSCDLGWDNALLSAYDSQLAIYGNDKNFHIYGVELRGCTDIDNYTLIDHHNEKQNALSSLEQVAELLGVELTREEKLVAANDRGYIGEMLRLGASWDEVRRIRLQDRVCQGVTEEEEELAQRSIDDNLRTVSGITIVEALTDKFSAICDRLYPCRRLLVHNQSTLVYYGEHKDRVVEYLKGAMEQSGAVYYGGGEYGFVGVASGEATAQQIIYLVENIVKLQK